MFIYLIKCGSRKVSLVFSIHTYIYNIFCFLLCHAAIKLIKLKVFAHTQKININKIY